MLVTPDRPARLQWSTADVDSRHALAYWVDTICESFLEIDIDSPDRHQFRARLDQTELGPATLHLVEADTQIIRRTPARIAHTRYAGYFLLHLRAGRLCFEQYGRRSRIEAGDCVLIDCNAPYRLDCLNTTRSVALRFPREWLRNWLPAPESLAGSPLRSGTGWSTALGAALATLDTDREEELALPEGVVAEQIAALLALAAGPGARASRGSEKLLNRIRQTIRDRCHMPGLTPGDIAAANGISKRYLHYLFAHSNNTFGGELMRTRLECAHRLLSDTRYTAPAVSEVAARCGFVEPSHFARRFRKAYGVGPTQFRAARLRPRPG
jgi:AraC family transcriptional regulator, positive regulator of tynA and feaB